MTAIVRPWDGNVARRRLTAWLDYFQSTGDGRAHFLQAYLHASDCVAAARAAGEFHDPDWVARLTEQAADYYFLTVEPDNAGPGSSPRAWTAAHQFAQDGCRRRDAVLLGFNAHVNSDLPRAVCDVLTPEWPMPSRRLDVRRADVHTLIDVVSEAFASQCDEQHTLRSWRTEVWENAMSLLTAADRPWRRGIVESIDCTAGRRAHLIVCTIEDRHVLLRMRAHELQRAFPFHHPPDACRLGSAPPLWGEARAVMR